MPLNPQSILEMLSRGASPEQQAMVQQMIQAQFNPAAQQLQQQGQRTSATLSGSAAARGLGKSSIGLGQQGRLGQALTQSLGGLQSGLQAQGLHQLLQMPFQQAGIASGLFGTQEQSRIAQMQMDLQRELANQSQGGSGLGSLFGSLAGSFIPGFGTALGGLAGGGIESLFRGGGGGGSGAPGTQQSDYTSLNV